MINKRDSIKTELKDKMRGGEGTIAITHLVDKDKIKNGRLMARIDLPVGASIGQHTHVGETEYYLIQEGEGEVREADGAKAVGPGDVVITGDHESHSIKNTGHTPLIMIAIIIFD
ncbi:MAG: cupin domain-containing protein [Spirochaetota bacterium]